MPGDSLILVDALVNVSARFTATNVSGESSINAVAAWCDDPEHTMVPSRRAVAVLLTRWRAGTLLNATPDESVWSFLSASAPDHIGALKMFDAANHVLSFWPSGLRHSAEGHEVVATALRCMLRVHSTAPVEPADKIFALNQALVLHMVLVPEWASLVHRTCSAAERQVLAQLVAPVNDISSTTREAMNEALAHVVRRAAAERERYGLRRCSLPACGAEEPHAKAFQVCQRCKVSCYCCREHHVADWKRHKRAECQPKPQDGGGGCGSASIS